MFANRIVAVSATLVLFASGSALADFKPGHVFVSDPSIKFCMLGDDFGWDLIWEIDPQTGEVSLFAELADELCGFITGLTFTPDGKGLRVSSFLNNSILEFRSDGTFTVVLDASDGIGLPNGSNNIAYDAEGNFYVVNTSPRNIMRFPAGGGLGHIAIALGGDLYFLNPVPQDYALRITPQGGVSLFDTYDTSPRAATADEEGHLYVGLGDDTIYRYNAGDPDSMEALVSGPPFIVDYAMAMSEDDTRIYVATPSQVVAVDPANGAVTLLAVIQDGNYPVGGIAVVPVPRAIPAVDQWGMVIMILLVATAGTAVNMKPRRSGSARH